MKPYPVRIPLLVQSQIRDQILFIAKDSIDNALAWEERLRKAIEEIGAMPGTHPIEQMASVRLGESVRRMVFEGTYLVFYRVDENQGFVDILNFRHGARLPKAGEL
ncbi:MAG: type II toxin-antitoxin system RelE/ParE family toxin [Burkholderiales bacterium]|nr:type II toxin-antitoxin system RelE/ParE family toxin [Phycisphaerae bacterium]